MKKLLILLRPVPIAVLSLLIISSFIRFYLSVSSKQLVAEFKNQNYREIYALDTLKISSRMNALSGVINWVCLHGEVGGRDFYRMEKGDCRSGLLQQRQIISIPEADNLILTFTIRLSSENENIALLFLMLQLVLIIAIIFSTKKSEEEKNEVEIKFSKIARQMSHDIRSPLATINAISDEVKSLSLRDQEILKDAILRINNISNNLLNSNVKKGYMELPLPRKSIINLSIVLSSIIEEKKREYSANEGVVINYLLLFKNCDVFLDEYDFRSCISNIINNSIEAKKDSFPMNIMIELEQSIPSEIEIIVRDNGVGIPSEILSSLGEKEITSKKSGNGLGVIHTFESVKSWNGRIRFESKVNEGTNIIISLPVHSPPSVMTVLLDDDELVRMTWESVAKKRNCILLTYSSSEELFNSVHSFEKNVIFYIDSELGNNIKGENVALELYELGFNNIFMASGYGKEKFANLSFLKGIRDKSPPWGKA